MGPIGCAFDTETTGLIDKYKLPSHENQPDIVQFCAKLFDENNVYATIDFLVVPDKPIDAKAESIHGISLDKIKAAGVPRRVMLSAFHHFVKQADFVCAHNLNFDKRVVQTAYAREAIDVTPFNDKKGVCTMLETTQICKIPNPNYQPGRDPYKWPSLQEAFCHLVNPDGFSGAHDAQVDVDALIAVYRALYYGTPKKASDGGNSRNA